MRDVILFLFYLVLNEHKILTNKLFSECTSGSNNIFLVLQTPLPEIGRRVRVNKYQKSVGWRYSVSTESPHLPSSSLPLFFLKLIPLCWIIIFRRPPLKCSCLEVTTYLCLFTYSHRVNYYIWTLASVRNQGLEEMFTWTSKCWLQMKDWVNP